MSRYTDEDTLPLEIANKDMQLYEYSCLVEELEEKIRSLKNDNKEERVT